MQENIRRKLFGAAALALIVTPGLSSCSNAGQNATAQNARPASTDAGGENAKALLKGMSDYLAAQKAISLSYDSIFEVVTKEHQKLQVATSGTVLLDRPDKIRTTRKAGFADTEMVYDGKTLSFLGKGKNAYTQAPMAGTIDTLIDQLRDKFHRQLPGADLLQSGVYDSLMTDVTDVKDLGSGVVGGKECDHLAFRAKDTDWQIWIAQGPKKYPCRYVITSKDQDQAPQFTMEIRDWKDGAEVTGADFNFKPPAGAKRLDSKGVAEMRETSDLPENYKTGAGE